MTCRKCEAYQQSDQMYCHKCNLLWDMNDPEPPECINTMTGREQFLIMREKLHDSKKK